METGDKGEIAKSYNILAAYYLQQKLFPEARKALEEAIKIGKEIGSLEAQKFAYITLSDVEEALENHKASLAAFKNFKILSDSMRNQLVNSEIIRLQLQYDDGLHISRKLKYPLPSHLKFTNTCATFFTSVTKDISIGVGNDNQRHSMCNRF